MPNSHYRCYFTDENDRIKAVEQIDCRDDAEAALKAEHLLASSLYRSAELWRGPRLVGKWSNTGQAPSQSEQVGLGSEHVGIIPGRESSDQHAK
jgi:hypothetical protein